MNISDSWREVDRLEGEADACVSAARSLRQASDTPAQRASNERAAQSYLNNARWYRQRAAAMTQRLNQRRTL